MSPSSPPPPPPGAICDETDSTTATATTALHAQTPETAVPTPSEATLATTDAPQPGTNMATTVSLKKRPASAMDDTTTQSTISQPPAATINAPTSTAASASRASPLCTGPTPNAHAHPFPPPGLRADQPVPSSTPVTTILSAAPAPLPMQTLAFTAMNAQQQQQQQQQQTPPGPPSAKRRKVNGNTPNPKMGRPSKQQQQPRPLMAARPLPTLKPAPPRPAPTFTPEPTPPAPEPQKMTFYSLPPELREEIYKLALANIRIHILPLGSDRTKCQHPLTLTSHTIRSEVLPLIHKTRPIQANITDFNFEGLLTWLSRIPVNEPKDTLCKNTDLRIYLASSLPKKEKPTNFESLRKWLHVRADPFRFQPEWIYEGPVAESKTATELRRRVARQTDVRKKEELIRLAKAVGVPKLDMAKKRQQKKKSDVPGNAAGGESRAAADLVEAMDAAGEGEGEEGERGSSVGVESERGGEAMGSGGGGGTPDAGRGEAATSTAPPNSRTTTDGSSSVPAGVVVGFRPAESFVPVNTPAPDPFTTPSVFGEDAERAGARAGSAEGFGVAEDTDSVARNVAPISGDGSIAATGQASTSATGSGNKDAAPATMETSADVAMPGVEAQEAGGAD